MIQSQMKMRQQMNPGGMMGGANNMMRNPQQFENMQANGMNMQKQAKANANRGGYVRDHANKERVS